MAVIKIVPMPGAVGDKGDEGAVGPQGPQGATGEQGPAGADALWSYNGPWQSNASYAEGDVVTYQGQLYYVKSVTTAGTLPTDTSKFDLLAAKGADGEPGLNGLEGEQGLQGEPGANGTNGADALWNYTGEYNGGASYAVGDLATYDGQLWYRANANGGNVGDTPSQGYIWNLLAAKGADFDSTNGLVVTGYIDDPIVNPAGTMALSVQGGGYTALQDLVALSATFNGDVNITNNGPQGTGTGQRIFTVETPTTINNDLTVTGTVSMPSLITSGTWDTNIKAQSGISGGYSIGLNSPSMGTYTKIGNVVNFYLTYNLSDEFMGQAYPVSYNSSLNSNFSFKLPFPIEQSIHGGASFNGYDYAMNNYVFTGRFFGRVDSSLPAGEFNQPDEEGWTEVHGIGFTHEDPNNRQSYVILSSQDFEDINTNSKRWRNMSHQWPFDFSGTTGHRYFQLQISGTYISA